MKEKQATMNPTHQWHDINTYDIYIHIHTYPTKKRQASQAISTPTTSN